MTVRPLSANYSIFREHHMVLENRIIKMDITYQDSEAMEPINFNFQGFNNTEYMNTKYLHVSNLYNYKDKEGNPLSYLHYIMNYDTYCLFKKNCDKVVRNFLSTSFDLNFYINVLSLTRQDFGDSVNFELIVDTKCSPFEIKPVCLYNLAKDIVMEKCPEKINQCESLKGITLFKEFRLKFSEICDLPYSIYVNVEGQGSTNNHCCIYRSDYLCVDSYQFHLLDSINFYKPGNLKPLPEYMTIGQLCDAINDCFPGNMNGTQQKCKDYVKFAVCRAKGFKVKIRASNQPGLKKKARWTQYVNHFMDVKIVEPTKTYGEFKSRLSTYKPCTINAIYPADTKKKLKKRMVTSTVNKFEILSTEFERELITPEVIEEKIHIKKVKRILPREDNYDYGKMVALLEDDTTWKVNIRPVKVIKKPYWPVFDKDYAHVKFSPKETRRRKERQKEWLKYAKDLLSNKKRIPTEVKIKEKIIHPEKKETQIVISDEIRPVQRKIKTLHYYTVKVNTDKNIERFKSDKDRSLVMPFSVQRRKREPRRTVDLEINLEDYLVAQTNKELKKNSKFLPKGTIVDKEILWKALDNGYLNKKDMPVVKKHRKNTVDIVKAIIGISKV